MADVNAASFEFYEGIRILVPGGVAVAMITAVGNTFDISGLNLAESIAGALAIALLLGLFAYYIDAPAKTAAFSRDLPTSATLKKWEVEPPSGTSLLNVYFVLLDEMMPAPVRARALYMGSIYRIGLESIYLIATSSIGVLLIAVILAVNSSPRRLQKDPSQLTVLLAAVVGHGLVFASATYLSAARARRRSEPPAWRTAVTRALRSLPEQISLGVIGLIAVVTFLQAAFIAQPDHRWVVLIISVLIVYLVWAVCYFRGWLDKGRRMPLDPVPAVALLGLASLGALVPAAMVLPDRSTIGQGYVAGWAAATLVANVLVCARGHEKRLRGSYASQNTWLQLYEPWVRHRYFGGPAPPRDKTPPLLQTGASRPPRGDGGDEPAAEASERATSSTPDEGPSV
jgi:hypothetical protein